MPWYVIYTKPRFEKKVADTLTAKGYDVYLPLRKVVRQWSDRKKKVIEPLIKSYVFIQCEAHHRDEVLHTPGVIRFLFWLGKPAEVRPMEIDAMRQFLGKLDYVPAEQWEYLAPGAKIDVVEGLFKNSTGKLVYRKGNKLLLNIDSLGQVIQVEVPIQQVNIKQ